MTTFAKVLPALQKERRSLKEQIDRLDVERSSLREKARALDRAIQALSSSDERSRPNVDDVRDSMKRMLANSKGIEEAKLRRLVRADLRKNGFNARGFNALFESVCGENDFAKGAGLISYVSGEAPKQISTSEVSDSLSHSDT